ncbi:sensor histidine kinase [Klugiella xanthotipulae]|uniref:histidine kinase n=1 Tax=Klugiella xanthotipulae TaxID=244735 RepID=A0A543I5Q2_9MICO|nr:sensor histidine kinase [Klugiella xanthotipulae]TQM65917.1 signal transduction histidine kinase [Klugiella xanthotipulae]
MTARNETPRGLRGAAHWGSGEAAEHPWGPPGPGWGHGYRGEGPPFRPPSAITLWLPVIVSLLVQVPATLFVTLHHGLAPAGLVAILLAAVGPLALLGIRRWPGPTALVVLLIASASVLLVDQAGPPLVSVAFAIVLGSARGAQLWVVGAMGLLWVGTLALGMTLERDWDPWRIATTTLVLAFCAVAGNFVRTRGERFRELRAAAEQRRQTAEQTERVRIARELHDVLAHSLSQINVQASVGLHLMDRQPDKAAEALHNIKTTSKTALDDVREVLGMLRTGDDPGHAPLRPQEGIADVAELVAGMEQAGVSVTLHDDTATTASAPVQFAIYRIVQESLTNVVRHSAATRVSITLHEVGDLIELTVTDNGKGPGEGGEPGGGLTGMRERAELVGGTFSAGADPDSDTTDPRASGFVVSARLPLRGKP